MSRILICGGDMRNACLAKFLHCENFDVTVCAIDKNVFSDSGVNVTDNLKDAAKKAELIILPLPVTGDNITLFAPLCESCFYLKDIFENTKNAIVCGGRFKSDEFEKRGIYAVDYALRDDFACLNAVPTAEGAIEAAMKHLPVTIFSSNVVVTGFGRCAKVLALTLKAMGALVTVCARSQKDLAMAHSLGLKTEFLKNMKNCLGDADAVFNTINYPVFGKEEIFAIKNGCIFIDVASSPGGVEEGTVLHSNIKYLFLPGLPGKYSPVSAAKIIWKTVLNIAGECGKDANLWNLGEKE